MKETYPKVETFRFRSDDLTVHKPDYPFHLIWIFKFLESSQVGQEGIDHILLGESLSKSASTPDFAHLQVEWTHTLKSSKRKSMFRITRHIFLSL